MTVTTTAGLLGEELRRTVRGALADGSDPWPALVELGVFGYAVPVDAGGLDLGLRAAALVCEELGRALVRPLPLDTMTAADHLVAARDGRAERWAAGEVPTAVAVLTEATLRDDTLTGRAGYVTQPAGALLVAAPDGSVRLLPVDRPGWSARPLGAIADAGLAELIFTNLPVYARDAVDVPWYPPEVLARDRVRRAAYLVGLADEAFRLSVRHTRARTQFDRPLADNQVIGFALAETAARLAAARRLTYHAAGQADRYTADALPVATQALAMAAELALSSTRQGVQLHGAFGMTTAASIQRYYRHALVEAVRGGRPAALWAEAGRLVVQHLAAGPAGGSAVTA